MIPAALQLTSNIPPLDGTVSKLQAADLEAQSVSFSEILKVEEKKLQQEITSASAAAVLATMQPPALPVFTPIPANGNTDAEGSAQSKPTVDSVSTKTIAPNIRGNAAPLEGNFTSTISTGGRQGSTPFTFPAETVAADFPFLSSSKEMNPVKGVDLKQPTVTPQTQTPAANLITQEPFSMDGISLPREYKAQVTKLTAAENAEPVSSQPNIEVMRGDTGQPAAKTQATTAEVSLPKVDHSPATKVTVAENAEPISSQPTTEVMRGDTGQPAAKTQATTAEVSFPKVDHSPSTKMTAAENAEPVSSQPINEMMRGNTGQPTAKTQVTPAEVSLPKVDHSPAIKVTAAENAEHVSSQPINEVMRGDTGQPAEKTQAAASEVSLPKVDHSPATKVTVAENAEPVSSQPINEVMRGDTGQPAEKTQATTAEVSLPKVDRSPATMVTEAENAEPVSSQPSTEVMRGDTGQPAAKTQAAAAEVSLPKVDHSPATKVTVAENAEPVSSQPINEVKTGAQASDTSENIKSGTGQPAVQVKNSAMPQAESTAPVQVTVENHDAVQQTPRAKIQTTSAGRPVNVDAEVKVPAQELAINAEISQPGPDNLPAVNAYQDAVSIPEQITVNGETEPSSMKDSTEKITPEGDTSAARNIVDVTPAGKQELPTSTTDAMEADLQAVDQTPNTSTLKIAEEPLTKAAASASMENVTETISTSQKGLVQNNGEMLDSIKTDQPTDGILSEAAGRSTVKEETDVPFEVKKVEEKRSSLKTSQAESNPLPLQTQSVGAAEKTSKAQVKRLDADITQQIMSELKPRIQNGEVSLHMQLNPKELGSIDIEMTKGPHGMQVSFVTEQASTGQLLESQVNQLKQSLKEAGVQLANLNISQHGQPRQEGGYRQEQTFVPFNGHEAPLAAKEENLRPLTSVGPHEIDYLV